MGRILRRAARQTDDSPTAGPTAAPTTSAAARQGTAALLEAGNTAAITPPNQTLRARFWGVRGTRPVAATSRTGGNTTCLELSYGRHRILFDAGSGIVALGDSLMREWDGLSPELRSPLTLLFTHAHHDHLCGLPFFAPLYRPDAELHLLGPDLAGMRFGEIIAGYMRSPYFPVDFRELPSRRRLRSIRDGARLVWAADADGPVVWKPRRAAPHDALVVDVLHSRLHPRDGTLVYRVSAGGASLVFATDVEIGANGSAAEQRLVRFASGADILIHDAQYSEDDYDGVISHRGFGHSTPTMAARVARAAGVRELILFHHDPGYDDTDVDALEQAARGAFPAVRAAREGLEICLDAGSPGRV